MLEDWSGRENEHSIAVNGVVKALDAAVLRVPVTGGAKVISSLSIKKSYIGTLTSYSYIL